MNTDRFFPKRSETLEQTGLHRFFLEDLACKILLAHLAVLPGDCQDARPAVKVIGNLLNVLKQRLILAYQNIVGFNVFYYVLTEQGRQKAQLAREQGEAPC